MIIIYTIIILIAVAFSAFFSASEMAFTTVNRLKLNDLADRGEKRARKLKTFLDKEGLFLGTTLVGTNIAVVVSSVLTTRILMEYFESSMAPLLSTVIMVPVSLVFGEIIPKMIAKSFSTELAMNVVSPISGFLKLFKPIIISVNAVAAFLISPFAEKKESWEANVSKSDLKQILLTGHATGEVEADEVELIHKVLDFGGKTVEKIMIPMYIVSSINESDTGVDLKRLVSLTDFSRIPVYSGNKNNIVGIANIYDVLFDVEGEKEKALVKDFMRDPVPVSKDDGLDIALARLRHRKQPMGIVVDEKSNAVGIVTIEDMLEEIVGEIEDRG